MCLRIKILRENPSKNPRIKSGTAINGIFRIIVVIKNTVTPSMIENILPFSIVLFGFIKEALSNLSDKAFSKWFNLLIDEFRHNSLTIFKILPDF